MGDGRNPGGTASRASGAGVHVVQLGYDDSVFAADASSDTLARHVAYGAILRELAPGSRATLLSVTGREDARAFQRDGVRFVPVHVPRLRQLLPRALAALGGLHREWPVGVVAAQSVQEDGWVALAFGRRQRVPVVGQMHFDLYSEHARRELFGASALGRLRYHASMAAIRRFTAMRVVGQRLRDRLVGSGYRGRVEVIPVPVTLNGAAASGADGSERDAARPLVLFVGRLIEAKNLAAWLEVALRVRARCPDARFHVVGDGPLLPELRARAAVLGLGDVVSFLGRVPYDALPAHYGSAALLLMTSHYEGFGRVAVEAGRFRLPVVAPRVTGLEDIVEPGVTGFLHEPGDLDGMAASVAALLDDEALRRRLGAGAARRMADHFDSVALSRRWMGMLIDVARRGA